MVCKVSVHGCLASLLWVDWWYGIDMVRHYDGRGLCEQNYSFPGSQEEGGNGREEGKRDL